MKKIFLVAISVLFLMTFSICLTGCSVPNNSSNAENHPTLTSQVKGTGIGYPTNSQNQPIPPESATAARLSSSPLVDKAIDYSKYIHKIWIDRSLMKSENKGVSFYISGITNGKIEGKCTINGLHGFCIPEVGPYQGMDYADLTGTIRNGIAYCNYFAKTSGAEGNFEIKFNSDNEIEVFFPDIDENSIYSPYTINDVMELEGFIPNENQLFEVNLNSWGNVNFVSGEISNSPAFYLTNKEGDILVDLFIVMGRNINVIKAVSFQDVDKNGLKDIIIIATDSNDSSNTTAKVILQQDDGMFEIDGNLNKEINDSGNNKDIKSITEHIFKKF